MGSSHQLVVGQQPKRGQRLWSLRGPLLGYVLGVDVAALVTVVLTVGLVPVTPQHGVWFALLAGCAVVHAEASAGIERMREVSSEGTGHAHLQSVWLFAGVLLLPPPLLTGLIVVSYTHAWVRVYRRRALVFRKVFSAASVVLACAASGTVLVAFQDPATGQPVTALFHGPVGLAAIVAAGALYRLINYALVVGAIFGETPDAGAREVLGPASNHLIIAAAVGLGTLAALVMVTWPWLVPLVILTVLALHMGLLLPQFREASRTDGRTGLLTPTFWSELVSNEIDRARRIDSSVGVLMVDLDFFKKINDTYGHPAGDAVLRAVADAIKPAVRGYDEVCRYGGEEFAVALPGLGVGDTGLIAERIRVSIAAIRVTTADNKGNVVVIDGLTASIGGAVYPDHGADRVALMQAADKALYEAKETGRNQTKFPILADLPMVRRAPG